MGRKIIRHILLVSLILMVAFVSAESGSALRENSSKIDSALALQIDGGNSKKMNVIVMFSGLDDPNLDGFDIKYRYKLIRGLAGMAEPRTIRRLAESDLVQGIYLDASAQISFPNDNASSKDYALEDYVSPSSVINADKLWQKGIDGRGVNVAVIDSGIDKDHPDLIGRVIAEKNFVADEISADDRLGHGTMVAGIIAGSGSASNGKYKGIAPNASLINVKVINSEGDGRVSDIIAGIEWAIYNGADVLSLSLGGINLGETNPPITMAADNAADSGAVVCVAAGNRNSTEAKSQVATTSQASKGIESYDIDLSDNGDSKNENVLIYVPIPIVLALRPGLIDSPGDGVKVITLGAVDANDHLANFSGSGPTRDDRIKPDVVAPGVDIISIVPVGLKRPNQIDEYYSRESGTSLSTPIAAGLSALLLQANGNLTPAGVKVAMIRGAQKLNNAHGEMYEEYYQGAGLLDALHSYQLLEDDLCGVIPDHWDSGRWAYLPAGKSVYVGIDTGADRPQKKIYALAPGDEDWNLRFVFMSNGAIENIKTFVIGDISSWTSLQALPVTILANDQKVFAASITVPADASPGIYNGSIVIYKEDKSLLTIPLSVTVAESMDIVKGHASKIGSLKRNEWGYYYLDVNPGTGEFAANLEWQDDAFSRLNLFLLSPASEYYAGEKNIGSERKVISNPASGRWLLAVHNANSSNVINYTLRANRSRIVVNPKRWDFGPMLPGTSANMSHMIENFGPALCNLSYSAKTENMTGNEFLGLVGYKETWNTSINVTNKTEMISASLVTIGGSDESEVALVFEDPLGVAKERNAALGSGNVGPVDIYNPDVGRWTLKVYGYDVPESGQSFRVDVAEYAEEEWSWLRIAGPKTIEADSSAAINATLSVPANTSIHRQEGIIKVSSDEQEISIPISVTVNGSSIQGLQSEQAIDEDNDGLFDRLSFGFGINTTNPGEFRLDGVLTDCTGRRIVEIDHSFGLEKSGIVSINISGNDILRSGKCGPLKIPNLILYDASGVFIDKYGQSIDIVRDPKQFQPPAAYFTGGFMNKTASDEIGIGVNLSIVKSGNYQVSGTIVDDDGETIGEAVAKSKLLPGNATIVLKFDPALFIIAESISRVHLVDLVLRMDEIELDRMDEAWSSGEMDPTGFERSYIAGNKSFSGAINKENGKIVIS